MLKQFISAMVILIFGMGLGYGILVSGPKLASRSPDAIAPLVRVLKVEPKTVQLSTSTHGTVEPRTESELIPEVSGRIVSMSDAMVSGGFFKKGDVLLTIEALDYEETLEQAKAGLTRAESDLSNSRRAHARQQDLARKQSTSAAQKDDALNRLHIAQATYRESKSRLSRAERDLERTVLIAPYDGRVRAERVDIGQFVNRGTAVAMLYATDYAEIRLPILDEELAFLDLALLRANVVMSAPIEVVLRARFAGEQLEWQGEIVRTEGELDPKTRMVNIVARIDAPYKTFGDKPPLAVGLFVEAEIIGRKVDGIVVLPRIALRNQNQVLVVDEENHLTFRSVDVLRIANDLVYVSAGLVAGEYVSVSKLVSPLDGMLVRPLEQASKELSQRGLPTGAGS